MEGTGPQSARLNGHVGARGAWSSRSAESEEARGQGRRRLLAQAQEPVSGEEGGGLWFIVMGSWTRRIGGPYREVLWL